MPYDVQKDVRCHSRSALSWSSRANAATREVADAAMRGDRDAVRARWRARPTSMPPQIDGTHRAALGRRARRPRDGGPADSRRRASHGADARRRDAAAARGDQRQRGDDRSADQGRRRSERAADAGRRHGADDGGAHRQDRRDSRAARGGRATSTRRRPGAGRPR